MSGSGAGACPGVFSAIICGSWLEAGRSGLHWLSDDLALRGGEHRHAESAMAGSVDRQRTDATLPAVSLLFDT